MCFLYLFVLLLLVNSQQQLEAKPQPGLCGTFRDPCDIYPCCPGFICIPTLPGVVQCDVLKADVVENVASIESLKKYPTDCIDEIGKERN